MSRKGISIDEELHERGRQLKGDESWNDLLQRAFDALEEQDGDVARDVARDETQDVPDGVLTEDHIDDIGAELERRLERTLETVRR